MGLFSDAIERFLGFRMIFRGFFASGIGEDEGIGRIRSAPQDESQSVPQLPVTVPQQLLEKETESRIKKFEDISDCNETFNSFYDKKQQLIVREGKDFNNNLESETLPSIGKEEESIQRLQNLTKSTIYNKFSRAGGQITSEVTSFAKRLLCPIKETVDIEKEQFSEALQGYITYTRSLKKVRKDLKSSEQLKRDAMDFLLMMDTFEKSCQEKSNTFKEYMYSLYKESSYQKALELSKTDDRAQQLFILHEHSPELKHFSPISLTDGHQYSERIVLLSGMLISLAPAIILPQQPEIILSHVKLSDILLSLVDQLSEVCVQYTWDMM